MEEDNASAAGSAGDDDWARSLADGVRFWTRRGLMIESSWWFAEAARGGESNRARSPIEVRDLAGRVKPAEQRSMTFAPF